MWGHRNLIEVWRWVVCFQNQDDDGESISLMFRKITLEWGDEKFIFDMKIEVTNRYHWCFDEDQCDLWFIALAIVLSSSFLSLSLSLFLSLSLCLLRSYPLSFHVLLHFSCYANKFITSDSSAVFPDMIILWMTQLSKSTQTQRKTSTKSKVERNRVKVRESITPRDPATIETSTCNANIICLLPSRLCTLRASTSFLSLHSSLVVSVCLARSVEWRFFVCLCTCCGVCASSCSRSRSFSESFL